MISSLILLRSLRVYILKQLFFSISVNSGLRNIYLATGSVNILPPFTSILNNNWPCSVLNLMRSDWHPVEATNIIEPSNVKKLTTNAIKPSNTVQTVYARKSAALNFSRTKISTAVLFRKSKTQFLLRLIERAPPSNYLGIFKDDNQ